MKDDQLDHGNYTMCKICIPRRPAGRSLYSPVGALAYAWRAWLGYLLRETCRAHESKSRRTLRRRLTPRTKRRCARSEDLVRLEALPRVSVLHDLMKNVESQTTYLIASGLIERSHGGVTKDYVHDTCQGGQDVRSREGSPVRGSE